jgi:hypothetical protein
MRSLVPKLLIAALLALATLVPASVAPVKSAFKVVRAPRHK